MTYVQIIKDGVEKATYSVHAAPHYVRGERFEFTDVDKFGSRILHIKGRVERVEHIIGRQAGFINEVVRVHVESDE